MYFTLADQTVYFLWSIAFGAALAVVYDIVRAVRYLLRAGRAHIAVSDMIFFALCGVLTSLFALPFNKGGVRAFTVFGEALGFLIYRLLPGRLSGRLYSAAAVVIRRTARKICGFLKKIYDLVLKVVALLLYNTIEIVDASLHTAVSGAKLLAGEARAKRRRDKPGRHGRGADRVSRRRGGTSSGVALIPDITDTVNANTRRRLKTTTTDH